MSAHPPLKLTRAQTKEPDHPILASVGLLSKAEFGIHSCDKTIDMERRHPAVWKRRNHHLPDMSQALALRSGCHAGSPQKAARSRAVPLRPPRGGIAGEFGVVAQLCG